VTPADASEQEVNVNCSFTTLRIHASMSINSSTGSRFFATHHSRENNLPVPTLSARAGHMVASRRSYPPHRPFF
jgi:hypothetical protein